MMEVLQDIVELMVGGITQLASGIGTGVQQFVEDLLVVKNSSGAITGASTFGGAVAVFAGVGLAVGITTLIFNWIRSLGN